MRKLLIHSLLWILLFTSVFVLTQSCKTTSEPDPNIDPPIVNKTITVLPDKEVKVYFGPGSWHELDEPLNYSKWSYVRENADGFHINFIHMWVSNYQDPTSTPQNSCNDMRKAFVKSGCFFETTLETSVNSGANGFNNDVSDKRSLDYLINAGFDVQYTSLNYGVNEYRVNLLRTYRGTRKCLCLVGPWNFGGNLISDVLASNKQQRANILTTDGVATDGPLGFWFNNNKGMREGSYSCAKFVVKYNLESAIMLAPSSGSVPGYDALINFLPMSKQCVFGHEDNNAAPDLWTIWTYGTPAGLNLFPESAVNEQGEVYALNTKAGVAYWLLRHLKTFPQINLQRNWKS